MLLIRHSYIVAILVSSDERTRTIWGLFGDVPSSVSRSIKGAAVSEVALLEGPSDDLICCSSLTGNGAGTPTRAENCSSDSEMGLVRVRVAMADGWLPFQKKLIRATWQTHTGQNW